MKIIVFGANGGIGSKVVEQGLEIGHEVTAVVRRPASITIQHPQLRVVQGDVLNLDTIKPVMVGQDAVISAIGISKDEPTTVYSGGIANYHEGHASHRCAALDVHFRQWT